jgi:glucosyl-3-phosphoglycerate phosphatase
VRRLVLVRHGESIWNAEGRVQGQSCAGLSELGHAQARAVAVALAATYPVASVVTSDLQRTVETTAPLAEALGVEPTLDATVRERSFGSWERRLRREVVADDPDRWQRWLDGEEVIAEVGGESATQLTDRVVPRLRELLASTPDGGVTIVVTHGGPIWHGTHLLLGLPLGTLGTVDNTSVTELVSWRGDDVVLHRWNETAHLPVELRTGWVPSLTSDAPPVGR